MWIILFKLGEEERPTRGGRASTALRSTSVEEKVIKTHLSVLWDVG